MAIFNTHVVILLIYISSIFHAAECESNTIKVPAFPAKIEAYENQDIYVQIPMHLKMESCIVKFRNLNATLWPQNIPPLLEEKVDFWGNSSVCGVRVIQLTTNDTGTWTLFTKSSNDEITESRFTVKVETFPKGHIDDEELFMEPSTSNPLLNFIPVGLNSTYYCIVRRPKSDEDIYYFNDECSKVVDSLTVAYDGEWSSRIGLKGMMEEMEYTFTVRVEEERIDSGIATSQWSSQNLYCNIISDSQEQIEYCLFIRPKDGRTLVVSDDMNTTDYTYYGNGFKNKSCGITIEKPQDLDYGIWKCIVNYGTVIYGSSVLLTNSNVYEIQVQEETLFKEVVLGSAVEIAVDAGQVINTCVYLSPDGTFILGIEQRMKFGECSIEISSVQKEHNGTWLCQMIINGQYTTAKVLVIVRESIFIADQTTKTVESGLSTTLSCHSVPFNSPINPSLGTCQFMRPDGFMMIMEDENPDLLEGYKYYGKGISKGECGVTISSVSPEDRGIWKCFAEIEQNSLKEEEFATFSLELSESTLITPTYVNVEQEGEVVIQFLDSFKNISSCSIKTPAGDVITLIDGGNSNVSYWGNKKNGECGAKINGRMLNEVADDYKKWQLSASTQNFQKETGNIVSAVSWIKVVPRARKSKGTAQQIFADEGSTVEIICGDGHEKDCIIVPPEKDINQGIIGSCKQNIQIHRTDFGVWTCYNGYDSHLLEEVKQVEIIDLGKNENIGWHNSALWKESTNLFCEVKKPLQYCSFVSPSGEAFKVQGGQGGENFVYYGRGLIEGDCGITILQPVEDLKGTWRCLFGVTENESLKHSARFINIMNDTDKYNVSDKTQIAILNQNTKIQCEIPETLTYCWIQHPNSSHFPSIHDAHNGICYAEISEIDNTYEGDWQCHMGTLKDELIITVTVKIAESHLYAVNKQVSNIENTVSFSCLTVVSSSRLQYCRFVRPDGIGFSFTTNIVYGKYEYQGAGIENGECGLKINDLSVEDYGQWTCAALISGETDEVMDTIIVLKSAIVANIIIGLTVGLSSAVGIIVILLLYWRKNIKRQRTVSSITVNSDSTSNSDVSIFSVSNNGSESGLMQ